MKRLRLILIIFFVVLLVILLAVRYFLSSSYLAEMVRGQIETAYGGPVQLDGINVGLSGSSLTGLRVYEKDATDKSAPIASVDSLETDLSLLGAVTGNTQPNEIKLDGVALTLRMDKDGGVATKFAAGQSDNSSGEMSLPGIELTKGKVTVLRPGFPEFVVSDIFASLKRVNEKVILSGRAKHTKWGEWKIEGDIASGGKLVSVQFKSKEPVSVNQKMLESLPFVSPSIWKHIRVHGRAPGIVTLRYDSAKSQFHYRIELDPENTTVTAPSVSLTATEVAGKVIIDDGLVKLVGVNGKAFDGGIEATGDMDFRGQQTSFQFELIKVQNIKAIRLPAEWKFPNKFPGRISAQVQLEVTFGKGKPQFRGRGQITPERKGFFPKSKSFPFDIGSSEGVLKWNIKELLKKKLP